MPNKRISDKHERARRSTCAMGWVLLASSVVATIAWHSTTKYTSYIPWHWYISNGIAILVLGITLKFRRISEIVSVSLLLLTVFATLFASAWTNWLLLSSTFSFEAFLAFKVSALAIAIIAPSPVWVGYFILAVCSLTPPVMYFALPLELRALFTVQEPWISIIYGVVGCCVLFYRVKNQKLELMMNRILAERRALREKAEIFLTLRDLMNTPLQSIELTSSLLKNEKINQQDGAEHLNQAMKQLRTLSQMLNFYEKDVDWSSMGISFDAITHLKKKLQSPPE